MFQIYLKRILIFTVILTVIGLALFFSVFFGLFLIGVFMLVGIYKAVQSLFLSEDLNNAKQKSYNQRKSSQTDKTGQARTAKNSKPRVIIEQDYKEPAEGNKK